MLAVQPLSETFSHSIRSTTASTIYIRHTIYKTDRPSAANLFANMPAAPYRHRPTYFKRV